MDRQAATWAQVVDAFAATPSRPRLVPSICGPATSYYFGDEAAPTLSPFGDGFGIGTGDQLQTPHPWVARCTWRGRPRYG